MRVILAIKIASYPCICGYQFAGETDWLFGPCKWHNLLKITYQYGDRPWGFR